MLKLPSTNLIYSLHVNVAGQDVMKHKEAVRIELNWVFITHDRVSLLHNTIIVTI